MKKSLAISILLFTTLSSLWAQETQWLISEGFEKGTLPSGWSLPKGGSINIAAQINNADTTLNLSGKYGISLNTQGYFLQLPEIESCGQFRFSFRGSSSPSKLGFKVQKMVAGSSSWQDVQLFANPISGNKEVAEIVIDEPKRVKLRVLLHDRTANTLHLDNFAASAYINPQLLQLKTDRNRIDFGNCIQDSTIHLTFIAPHDSIDWIDLSIPDEGFEIPNRINLKEQLTVSIRFVGSQYRSYESLLNIVLGDRFMTLPLSARHVSSTLMTQLADLVYGEEHPDWTIKAVDSKIFYILGESPDSIYLPINNLSNCQALQIEAQLRTYNGNSQQYLAIEYQDRQNRWHEIGRLSPETATLLPYELLVPLQKLEIEALRFRTKTTNPSHKIGIQSITINGAFGNALPIDQQQSPTVRITSKNNDLIVHANEPIGRTKITTIHGKTLLNKEIPSHSFLIKLPKGIYIIEVNGQRTKRIL